MIRYLSFDQMVEDLMLFHMTQAAKVRIGQCTKLEIYAFHSYMGHEIRRMYHLWDENNPETMLNYQPNLVAGVDVNPKHPENVSKQILLAVWEFMK